MSVTPDRNIVQPAGKSVDRAEVVPASFRDPSGFVFRRGDFIFRQVNLDYKEHYEKSHSSGLYDTLVNADLMIPYREIDIEPVSPAKAYKVIQPEMIPFISYPYEWSFSQLKAAALATLEIQKIALKHGMILKDCSAYNIQFRRGRAVLIDTLSLEEYREGEPWSGYRQFCQHFFAPLALMANVDVRLSQLLRIYIDGVPLDLAKRLLPWRDCLKLSIFLHIYVHASAQARFSDRKLPARGATMSRTALQGLVDNLQSGIQALRWKIHKTEWGDYYSKVGYEPRAFEHKKQIVAELLATIRPPPKNVWDLGANTGVFSRLASSQGIPTTAFDVDPNAVERNYLECIERGDTAILPLLLDITNPSPGLGWGNNERMSFFERSPADTALALAFVHHLAISHNVPLTRIAYFFSAICRRLIIEFVPKTDVQTQRLLSTRKDIFPNYTRIEFERTFKQHFTLITSVKVKHSQRVIYLFSQNA